MQQMLVTSKENEIQKLIGHFQLSNEVFMPFLCSTDRESQTQQLLKLLKSFYANFVRKQIPTTLFPDFLQMVESFSR